MRDSTEKPKSCISCTFPIQCLFIHFSQTNTPTKEVAMHHVAWPSPLPSQEGAIATPPPLYHTSLPQTVTLKKPLCKTINIPISYISAIHLHYSHVAADLQVILEPSSACLIVCGEPHKPLLGRNDCHPLLLVRLVEMQELRQHGNELLLVLLVPLL